jgi:hypothetical protein
MYWLLQPYVHRSKKAEFCTYYSIDEKIFTVGLKRVTLNLFTATIFLSLNDIILALKKKLGNVNSRVL